MADEKDFCLAIGRKIDAVRKQRNMSFQKLADKAGIEKAGLVRITQGHNTTILTLVKIANALEIHPKELWNIPN